MSIKVLLADDNITAQRLGSKILTEAGYEVIAVSNGAAAVKKIAAEKPNLLILDVYMPGYTGLEVCEKVKHDPSTSAVPVVLTATNMEPYNQADGNRVGADGFMIKPFEASDLIAVVQKFESRMKPASDVGARTIKMAAVEEIHDASYEEWKSEAEEESIPARMEVPQEMAAAPALGMDEYEAPPPAPAFTIEQTPAPAFVVDSAPASTFDLHPAEASIEAAPAPLEMHSLETAPTQSLELPSLDLSPAMPTLEHAVEAAHPAEFEATSAPLAPSLEVATAPELETTLVASTETVVTQDPGLVTDADEMSHFATGFGVQNAEEIPVGVAMPVEEAPAHPEEADAPTAELERLSTQRIETYHEPEATSEAGPGMEMDMQRAFAVSSSGAAAAPAPAIEPEPQPEPPAESAAIPEHLVAQFAAELDQAHQEREAMGEVTHVEEAHSLEASMEPAPEIPASQLDEEKIAAAVNRALEKYKDGLRSELIATIVRELKG